jgi:hypothetical protein
MSRAEDSKPSDQHWGHAVRRNKGVLLNCASSGVAYADYAERPDPSLPESRCARRFAAQFQFFAPPALLVAQERCQLATADRGPQPVF